MQGWVLGCGVANFHALPGGNHYVHQSDLPQLIKHPARFVTKARPQA